MLIFIDDKVSNTVKQNLSKYGKVVGLSSTDITNDYLSGHVDIFLCPTNSGLVVAPNIPQKYLNLLTENTIRFSQGDSPVQPDYPGCARYNAATVDGLLIHKSSITDLSIIKQFAPTDIISIKQGLTRCSLLPLDKENFITSDGGLFKSLSSMGKNVLLVDPLGIVLPGFRYGFFGGTCGVYNNVVYFLGSLSKYTDGEKVKLFLNKLDYKIVELSDEPLYDGGGVLFIDS